MSVPLTVVTANIGRGVTQAVAATNVARIRATFPTALVGWQEIDEADTAAEHAILRHTFGAGYSHVGFGRATPISVPAPWRVVWHRVTLACEGLAQVTPTRWVVAALCTHPALRDPVWFLNGHYPLARLGGAAGQARWDDTQATWVSVARDAHRDGLTVVTTRDTNRHGPMPWLHPAERQLLAPGIDRISVIPGSVALRVTGRETLDLTIDGHDAQAVHLTARSSA